MSKTEETKGKSPIKKGTTSTELVIGTAAANIKKSIAELTMAVAAVSKLSEQAETMQAIIAQKEDKINELDTVFSETRRAKQVELEVSLKEDEQKVVNNVLAKQGLTAIASSEYSKLTTNFNSEIKKAEDDAKRTISIATASMQKDHDSAKALADSQFATKEAESKAKIEALSEKVNFLIAQVDMWKSALDEERKAGVERSKAASIGTLNVGGPSK